MAEARLELDAGGVGVDPERAAAWQAFLRAARAATERLARAEAPSLTGRPMTAHGTATFRCGATARVAYPADARDALHRFRRSLRHRDCPGCAGGAHAPAWRVTVRSAHRTRWWWRELTVRREDGR